MQRVLDIADHRIDPGEFGNRHAVRATAGRDTPMWTSIHDRPKASETVGCHLAVGAQVFLGPGLDRGTSEALDRGQPHA